MANWASLFLRNSTPVTIVHDKLGKSVLRNSTPVDIVHGKACKSVLRIGTSLDIVHGKAGQSVSMRTYCQQTDCNRLEELLLVN